MTQYGVIHAQIKKEKPTLYNYLRKLNVKQVLTIPQISTKSIIEKDHTCKNPELSPSIYLNTAPKSNTSRIPSLFMSPDSKVPFFSCFS